jgi:hypothetical protein
VFRHDVPLLIGLHRVHVEERSKAFRPDEHPTFIDAWKEIEKLLETGKSREGSLQVFKEVADFSLGK